MNHLDAVVVAGWSRMKRFALRRPSPAMVVALVALFVAGGGVSYGVATGSITSREIKDGTIRGKDVRNNSLTGADVTRIRSRDISNGSLLARDFKAGQLPAGPRGPRGLKGDKGAPGDPAAAGPGRSAASACNPLSDTRYVSCASVTLRVPAAGRVLLVADAQWYLEAATASGRCRFTGPGTSNHQVEPGGSASQGAVGLNEVTRQVPAGTHTFGVQCRELSGNTIRFLDYMIAAVYVGTS